MTLYGKILLILCVVDMVSTVLGIHYGFIEEANPFMRWHLEKGGLLLLASVKILMTSVFILVLETIWNKKLEKRSKLKAYYIGAIVIYILLYVICMVITHKEIFI